MKVTDWQISTLLKIGMGTILLFVMVLGTITFLKSENLWQKTKGLYDHPLAVQRALGDIRVDVLAIRLEMKELVVEENEHKIQERMIAINHYEADAYRQFTILYDRYLGSRDDIDTAYNSIVQYKTIRDETIRLVRAGKYGEVMERSKFDGIGGAQLKKVMEDLGEINVFAKNKADEFYMEAQQQKEQYIFQLLIVLVIIVVVAGIIIIVLRKGILVPLKELTAATEKFQKGKLDSRSGFVSSNEFGKFASTFNIMAQTVELEMKNKENMAKISATMLRENELYPFCQDLLSTLLQHTGSQVGAIYLLNEQKTDFEHFSSIGLCAGLRARFSATRAEGEFGSVLATGQIQQVTEIPFDTQFTFSTVIGDFKPKEILTIPILDGSHIVAIISLASIRSYSPQAIQLVAEMWKELTARLNSVLAFRQANELSLKLQNINRELEAQTQELAMQAVELTEQNIELEMQKQLLDEVSKLKSSFLSNMSHELRTPLNSVIALTSVLNRRLRGIIPEDEYGYLDVIERNGKHLLSLVNDILDLARIEAGKEEIIMSCFTIQELVGEVVEMIDSQAQMKEIILQNNISSDLPRVYSDMSMCRHIIQNMISNAVKFTQEGSVEISAVLVENVMQISITDTGIGIAAEQLHYIFDEFRQADETTARKYGGTGLGLAIAKKYATLLGGSITVESMLGKGSTFTLQLPLTVAVQGEVSKSMELRTMSRPAAVSGQGKRILLVEDSEPAIIQMKDILMEQGYEISIARNGKEALESIEKNIPAAMILDLMMPEVDGFQVLKAIRKIGKTAEIPVLILTAKHVTKEELSFLTGNHIFQLIQKGSIGKTELLEAVSHMVWGQGEQHVTIPPKTIKNPVSDRPIILVVEDNIDNITTVKALLAENYEVIAATDGPMGIEQAKLYPPALILLDISLPGMDGFQVLKELRKAEEDFYIPIIALTARAMSGDREEILASGFNGYISKPIDGKLLEKTIRRVLYAT